MNTNRFFKLLIALALVIALAFTVQEAVATSVIRSGSNTTGRCERLPSSYSIHKAYQPVANMWVLRTDDGPTGVDGGLIELLSGYRSCSR